MTSLNSQAQIIELTDDQLEAAQGGFVKLGVTRGTLVDITLSKVPVLGKINMILKPFGISAGQLIDG